ncbi:MAG: M15 family metallopeptidase [Gemmatimonadaceae bacterium]|nr:M15 family metallopeptidase [Gemmatimonadaceae bacterium]
MSAGAVPTGHVEPTVDRDLTKLPPKFRDAVRAAIADCAAEDGLDPYVYEAGRSRALAELYYKRGRTIIPPTRTVTNAPNETFSWHGFLLAVDVISRKYLWFDNAAARARWPDPKERAAAGKLFWRRCAVHFKAHGCKWGGDWKQQDDPHYQWGRCKPSPSNEARRLLATSGIESVWRAVGAI